MKQAGYLRTFPIRQGIVSDHQRYSGFLKIEAGKLELESAEFSFFCTIGAIGRCGVGGGRWVDFLIHIDPKIPHYLIGDDIRLSSGDDQSGFQRHQIY